MGLAALQGGARPIVERTKSALKVICFENAVILSAAKNLVCQSVRSLGRWRSLGMTSCIDSAEVSPSWELLSESGLRRRFHLPEVEERW